MEVAVIGLHESCSPKHSNDGIDSSVVLSDPVNAKIETAAAGVVITNDDLPQGRKRPSRR